MSLNYVYHIFTKSIAGFVIFNNKEEFIRALKIISYYQFEHDVKLKFSTVFKTHEFPDKFLSSHKIVKI
jgi:hypothetical protein